MTSNGKNIRMIRGVTAQPNGMDQSSRTIRYFNARLVRFRTVGIRSKGKLQSMSEKHPECPLYNPLNCKEYHNPKLCAFVRKDKACLKKKKPKLEQSAEMKP
ncbi:MAG: hypothetical protein WAM73_20615 [Desulfobacterales bacterium]